MHRVRTQARPTRPGTAYFSGHLVVNLAAVRRSDDGAVRLPTASLRQLCSVLAATSRVAADDRLARSPECAAWTLGGGSTVDWCRREWVRVRRFSEDKEPRKWTLEPGAPLQLGAPGTRPPADGALASDEQAALERRIQLGRRVGQAATNSVVPDELTQRSMYAALAERYRRVRLTAEADFVIGRLLHITAVIEKEAERNHKALRQATPQSTQYKRVANELVRLATLQQYCAKLIAEVTESGGRSDYVGPFDAQMQARAPRLKAITAYVNEHGSITGEQGAAPCEFTSEPADRLLRLLWCRGVIGPVRANGCVGTRGRRREERVRRFVVLVGASRPEWLAVEGPRRSEADASRFRRSARRWSLVRAGLPNQPNH